MRLSIQKRESDPFTAKTPSIRPGRDAFLAGLAVAGAISLGAYVVYARAWSEKVEDVRHHVLELARRLSHSSAGSHETARKLSRKERAEATAALSAPLSYVRDNTEEVRRIYTFALDDDEKFTLLDTGGLGQKAAPQPIPDEARKARAKYRGEKNPNPAPWTINDGLEATAFSLLPGHDGRPAGIIGVETNAGRLAVKLSTVRQALWFTCALGLGVGVIAGIFVWQMRWRARAALALLEESHRTEEAIIASLGEVIYTFDTVTGIYRWRGEVRTQLGFDPPPEGLRQSEWLARLHQGDGDRYVAAQKTALEQSRPMQIEYRVRRADGSELWVMDRGHPLRLRDGHVHFVGSLIDLTARREAEETLRLFFDETATAHIVFDGDAIIDANPSALELFAARDKAALAAEPIWKLWPRRQPSQAYSAEAWAAQVLAAMEGGVSHFEWSFMKLDGARLDCDVFLRPATLRGRAVLLMACFDISSTKQAQKQLIESEQRFRDVSEAAGEFIWEVNAEGRYVYASARVSEVLGAQSAYVIGRSPFEFVPEQDRPQVQRDSEKIHASGLAFRNFEHRTQRIDGTIRWISVSGVPIHDSAGRVVGYRGASLDITKHRDYERELLLQKEAAESADRAKSSFLAMMSHEIRTPLNSVLGFADLVLDTPLTDVQREYLRTIKGSGDALLGLLNDILDFSKIESGRMEIEIRPTNLPRLIREVMDLHQLGAAAKHLELTSDYGAGVPEHVLTDPARLRQILLNLVGNAVKFTPHGGAVHIATALLQPQAARPGAGLRILVADNGIGITPEQRERLFQPFTQADSSTTRRFGGTGLGLAISRRLAMLLEGTLGLLERDGPGSTFYIDIPARLPSAGQLDDEQSPEPDTDICSTEPESPECDAIRVLVVDDNTLNRRLTSHLLHQLGAETTAAASAQECFEQLDSAEFDLVLMDVQMPVMDGLEATRRIRAREQADGSRPVPIIALTADAMVGDRERCMEAGMDDYLTKPLRREELARLLRSHTRRADSTPSL